MNRSSFSTAITFFAPASKIDRESNPGPGPTSITRGVFSETCAVRTILSFYEKLSDHEKHFLFFFLTCNVFVKNEILTQL